MKIRIPLLPLATIAIMCALPTTAWAQGQGSATVKITYPTSSDVIYTNSNVQVAGDVTWTGTTAVPTMLISIIDGGGSAKNATGSITVTSGGATGGTGTYSISCLVGNTPGSGQVQAKAMRGITMIGSTSTQPTILDNP